MNKNSLYHLVKKEILTIQSKYFFKNVLLCISGGLDSIVLFDIVNRINKEEKRIREQTIVDTCKNIGFKDNLEQCLRLDDDDKKNTYYKQKTVFTNIYIYNFYL